MVNPDTTTTPSSNVSNFVSGFPVALFFLLVTTFLFQLRDSFAFFKLILWASLLTLTFFIISGVNTASQYINCKTTNIGKAILGSFPSVIGVAVALGIASISYCRIPITSVFAPFFVGKTVDITQNSGTGNVNRINSLKNNNSKECCVPKLTLESVESKFPLVTGLAYGFYVMFGILFGTTIGSGISSIC